VQEVAGMVGDGARQLVERVLVAAAVSTDISQALAEFLAIYSDRLLIHTRPYDGIHEAVAGLAGRVSLVMLTNKPEGLSRRLLEAFGLDRFFSFVIGGDSGFPRKPDPAGLLHLIAATGVGPDAALLVGDSMVDVETARRAGTSVCVAQYGFGQLRRRVEFRGDELVANRPGDLARVLDLFVQHCSAKTTT
jgi:phosphoglycolate phosphatase